MVIISQIQSHKITCSECNKEVNIIFTCSKCGSQYCKAHKNIDSHNCEKNEYISQSQSSSINTIDVEKIYAKNNTVEEANLDNYHHEKVVISNKMNPKNKFLQKYAYSIFYLCIFTIILGIFGLMFFL
jgi:hypothetical protein